MWTWKLSGGVLFTTRVVRAAWALEPAPPAMALFVTLIVGLSALNLSMMALKPLASPPVVHHETTSTCVTAPPGAFVPGAFVPGAFVPGAVVVVLLEQAETTRAATENRARIRRDGSFTANTSLTLDVPMKPSDRVGGSGRRPGQPRLADLPQATPGDHRLHQKDGFCLTSSTRRPIKQSGLGRPWVSPSHTRAARHPEYAGSRNKNLAVTLADADNVVNLA